MQPRILRLQTSTPAVSTLRIMGANAQQAARTWTMREWAARLATQAGPRDYVGQLRQLYGGILQRWRYVQEPGEWTYGKPASLLGFCLGANYNRGPSCPSPLRCDIEATQWRERGWGDCDDVAQLAAAGALALGMPEVRWRVARWPTGAHVSAVVRTPQGEWVSVDPVGHPKHPFGWALAPKGGQVRWFDLRGRPRDAPRARRGARPMPETYLSGPEGCNCATVARQSPHVVLTHPGDTRGARTLGVPLWHHRIMKRGAVMDGTPAMDQYGEQYQYDGDQDLWVPLSGWFKRMRKKVRRRFARARKRVRRVFKKTRVGRALLRAGGKIRRGVRRVAKAVGRSRIAKLFRKAKAKILGSKIVQGIAANALQVFGVPRAATRAMLAREVSIAKQGGRAKLIELLAAGKRKQAARWMLKSLKAGARGAIPPAMRRAMKLAKRARRAMSGPDDVDTGQELVMGQNGAQYTISPVEQFHGMAGVVELGQIDAKDTVEPSTFYKIQKGDTMLEIGQALNDGRRKGGPFGSRLKALKVINSAAYNHKFHRASKEGFETKYIGPTIVSLSPRGEWGGLATIWIPPARGVEPPEICPPGSEYDMRSNTCSTLPVPEPPEPPPTPDEPPPPEPPPVEPPAPEPPKPVLPDEPKPAPPAPPIVPAPAPAPVPKPATAKCPKWFFPSPADPSVCRPVVAPGGPGCPDGMEWDAEEGLMGGCVPIAAPPPRPAPIVPAPAPAPRPAPARCPQGQVWSPAANMCVTPGLCPEGYEWVQSILACRKKAAPTPRPVVPAPVAPGPPPPGPPAAGGQPFPWWALLAAFSLTG